MRKLKPLSILVVEDEFLIAAEIASILEEAGHAVLGPIGSIEKALSFVAAPERPDFAIIDANLRGVSSAPVAERMRDLGIPFCICSGYRSSDLKGSFGEATILQKPLDAHALLSVIGSLAKT